MPNARRAGIKLFYNGVDISRDIAPFLLNFSYTDQAHGKSDDLQVTLQDREGNWRDPWFPEKGATLTGQIEVFDWDYEGDHRVLPCGRFEIDEVTCKAPPTTVDVKSISVPITTTARQERRSKGWEKIKLSIMAREIATNHGLEFFWQSSEDPLLDRRDQIEASDLSLLKAQCERLGLAVKVTDVQLVIFDEREFEKRPSVATIHLSDLNGILKSFSLRSKTANTYKGAKLQYHDPVADEDFEVYKAAEGAQSAEQTLNINERVKSLGEAETVAEKRLYQKNKREVSGNMSLRGNMAMLGGSTVDLSGFGVFDGRYFIEKATHKYSKSSGYTTDIDIRRGVGQGGGSRRAPSEESFPVYGGAES